MSGHHGRPTAAELIDAVAGFLEGEVRANTTGAVNFHALVAANALLATPLDTATLYAATMQGEAAGAKAVLRQAVRSGSSR